MTFNFNARYALLTYAQCGDLDGWQVSDHFTELRAECIVAREAHATDGVHLHAFVDFGRKFRSRRSDIFDVGGRHPNISPTHTTPQSGFDYACKDGDIVAGGLGRPESGVLQTQRGDPWPDIVLQRAEQNFRSTLGTCSTISVHLLSFSGKICRLEVSQIQSHINTTETYASTWMDFQNSMTGHKRTLDNIHRNVSILLVEKGDPGTKSSGSLRLLAGTLPLSRAPANN